MTAMYGKASIGADHLCLQDATLKEEGDTYFRSLVSELQYTFTIRVPD